MAGLRIRSRSWTTRVRSRLDHPQRRLQWLVAALPQWDSAASARVQSPISQGDELGGLPDPLGVSLFASKPEAKSRNIDGKGLWSMAGRKDDLRRYVA